MRYVFSATVEKARKSGFASLTEWEKWEWHADVYGFRRVLLGIDRDQQTSPCDPHGEWFDAERAAVSERYYRLRFEAAKQRRQQAVEAALYA